MNYLLLPSLVRSWILLITLLLVSCATTQAPHVSLRSPYNQAPQYYLTQASTSSGDQKQTFLLQATAAYFYAGNFDAGRSVLNNINASQLSATNLTQYKLLTARLAINDNQLAQAMNTLAQVIADPTLSPQMHVEALNLQAMAQTQLNLPVDSVKTRILITPLLTDADDKVKNQQQIWQTMNTVPTDQLQSLSQDPTDPILQGWAALTLTVQQNINNPQQLISQLKLWQAQFPNHPASPLVSTDMSRFATTSGPQQVAILLPLQGNVQPQAQAVLNGIMAAYFAAQQQGSSTPQLKIYDTTTTSVTDLYRQAIKDGAQFVIGPLTKTEVQQLADHGDITVPTLALNYSDDASLPKNFYEYALLPIDEAATIADRAAQLGYVNALIISPNSDASSNVQQKLVSQWQQDSGRIVGNFTYDSVTDLKNQVATLLNIDQSNFRYAQLKKIINQPLEFSPRRRQDIDVIFLNTSEQDALQILPLLRYYYAGDLPMYATAAIYSGFPNPGKDTDLNGIRFPIMPWEINPTPTAQQLRKNLLRLWPQSFRKYSSLYAFGIDAYTLMTQMEQLKAFPQLGLSANTGVLFLNNDRIQRQTEWAEFVAGAPQLITVDKNVIVPLNTKQT